MNATINKDIHIDTKQKKETILFKLIYLLMFPTKCALSERVSTVSSQGNLKWAASPNDYLISG